MPPIGPRLWSAEIRGPSLAADVSGAVQAALLGGHVQLQLNVQPEVLEETVTQARDAFDSRGVSAQLSDAQLITSGLARIVFDIGPAPAARLERARALPPERAAALSSQLLEQLRSFHPDLRRQGPPSQVSVRMGATDVGCESWGVARGRAEETLYNRIGSLFFLNAEDLAALPSTLQGELAGNALRVHRLQETYLSHPSLGAFTTTCILAMTRAPLEGKRWIGCGAGDGIMELVAAKLGASSLDLIDRDAGLLERAHGLLSLNGLAQAEHFRLLEADLSRPEGVVARLQPAAGTEAVLASNIGEGEHGPWPEYAITNDESLQLLTLLEARLDLPRIGAVVLGGYRVEFTPQGVPDPWEVGVTRSVHSLHTLGFETGPTAFASIIDGHRLRGTLAMLGTRQGTR